MNQKPDAPSTYKKYKSLNFSDNFSDEEMARDWTLSPRDLKEIKRYRKEARLYIAIQICSVRLYGRFLQRVNDLSVRIINYLNSQLNLPTNLFVHINTRKATISIYRNNVLSYLGFQKFGDHIEKELTDWLLLKVKQGKLPDELFLLAQEYLLSNRVLLPGSSILDKLVTSISAQVHVEVFERIYKKLPQEIIDAVEEILKLSEGEQRTFFFNLKEFPPSASISTLKNYLTKYQRLMEMGIDQLKEQLVEPAFQQYLFELTGKYNATDIKRFNRHKRYALMICFLLESRKQLLDYLVKLHDQFMTDMVRKAKNTYEKQYRKRRHRLVLSEN